MRPMEATSNDSPIVLAKTSAGGPVGAGSAAGAETAVGTGSLSRFFGEGSQRFASVLAATRQSSNTLMQMLAPKRADTAGQTRDLHDHRAAESRTDGSRAGDAPAKGGKSDKLGRADRTRSQTREQAKTGKAVPQSVPDQSAPQPVSSTPSVTQERAEQHATAGRNVDEKAGTWADVAASTADGNMMASLPEPGDRIATVSTTMVNAATTASASGSQAAAQDWAASNSNVAWPPSGGEQRPAQPAMTAISGPAPTGNGQVPSGQADVMTTEQDAQAATAVRAATATNRSAGNSDFQQLLSRLDVSGPTEADRGQLATGTVKSKDATGKMRQTIDLDSPGSVAELARVVKTQIGSRRLMMVLDLSPAELGRVRVDVRMQDSAVTLRFATETITGQQEIKSRLNDLKRALEQQGITVDRVSVELLPTTSGPNRGHESAHQQPQPDAQRWDLPADGGGRGGQQGSTPDSHRDGSGPADRVEAVASRPLVPEGVGDRRQTSVDLVA